MAAMTWAEVNGASLRYEVSGDGRDGLVLIHEMGSTLESWDEVVPLLPAGRRILRYDMRGCGLSEKLRGTGNIDDFAADVAGLLDHTGIAGRVVVVGGAVGGAVAIRFAARYPDRTAGLIAMAPAAGVAPDRRAAAHERARMLEERGMRFLFGDDLERTYPSALRTDPARVEAFRLRQLGTDPASYAAIHRMIIDLDMSDDFRRIRCPTLVLCGSLDPGRTPDIVKPFADQIPGARFEVIETGHYMPVHTPELIADRISEFLALAT